MSARHRKILAKGVLHWSWELSWDWRNWTIGVLHGEAGGIWFSLGPLEFNVEEED